MRPGSMALQFVGRRHEGGVRATEAHGDAEALRGADRDVGSEVARRRDERERHEIGGDDDERPRSRAPGR